MPKLDSKMHFYLRRASKPPGIGLAPVNGFDGLPMGNDATVKGSQGKPHVEWLRPEHPFTAISPKSDVHKEGVRGKFPPAHFRANHNEAQNSSLRRRASAYHRRQNHYAKVVEGLQRALSVQRLIHNWVRPHWGLKNNQTPAMAMGYLKRPITMLQLLSSRGLQSITP